MDAELRFHLDQQIQDYIARGMPRDEAERRARLEFGTLDLAKDECRDQRATEWARNVRRDIRHAARSLRKSPGFASVAILSLALGIGANTAIFSLVDSLLLRSLPVHRPGDLVQLAQLALGVDAVLLDNMTIDEMRRAVTMAAGKSITEASGRVTPATTSAIAATGVDLMSVGWLVHIASILDIGLDDCREPATPLASVAR